MFEKDEWEEAVIHIGGMHCDKCSARMAKAFTDAKGVREANVDLESKSARVVYDAGKLSEEDLKKIVTETGYTPV